MGRHLVSDYPWDILGITPTRDELTIRRAYARMLRKSRPDENPEGFARLVAAREHALHLLATGGVDEAAANEAEVTALPEQSEIEASQSLSSKDFCATVALSENVAEETIPPEQSEADPSQGFSSSDSGETVTLADTRRFDVQIQAAAFTAIMNRLQELVRGVSVDNAAPLDRSWKDVIHRWDADVARFWDAGEWRSILSGLTDLTFEQRRTLRDFIVREALPQLPMPPTDGADMKRLLEGGGTGAVVNIWEAEFAIRHDQATLAQYCGSQAMLRYLDWLALAERVSPLHKRTEAERRFIDCLDKVLPPRTTTAFVETPPTEAWLPDRWEELFALVRQMGGVESARCRDLFAERLTTWLPNLPAGPLAKLGAGTAPAIIVEKIEREFALTQRLDSPLVDRDGASHYQDWLVYAHRMRAVAERCAKGASAYRVIPPEDLLLDVLPDKDFGLPTFLLPASALAKYGLPWPAAGLLVIEGVAFFGLHQFFVAPYHAMIFTSAVVAVHLLLALTIQRLGVMAAIHRVRRADHQGLINPGERRFAIASREPDQQIMASFFFVGLLLPVATLFLWIETISHAERPQNPATQFAAQSIQVGETLLQAHNTHGAIFNFTYVIEQYPRAMQDHPTAERAYRGRAEAFLEAGDPLKAIDDFSHLIMLNSRDTEAHLQRALAYTTVGRNDLATEDYAAVVAFNPSGAKQRILLVWQRAVSIYLNRNLRYPADRDKQDVEVTVQFSIDRNGHLLSKSIEKSSGDSAFDAEALSMLERSDPLPPPPPPVAIGEESWNFRIPVVFRANSKGG